ncbi:MAG: hypothetical protein M1818_000042 [Claussenomyces sp. TS43310]|nr:MAG: hypothetical protein M1818_000042 [Claussenomyces sp. TS43310]
MTRPFNEYEKRFVLTEVIRTSAIPLDALIDIVKDAGIEPKWEEVLVPGGRNLKACATAFQDLLADSLVSSEGRSAATDSATNARKRRHLSPEPRALKPRPAANGTATASALLPSGQPHRKRGRPSNAELAVRMAEAEARGEAIAPGGTPGGKSLSGDLQAKSLPASAPKSEPGTGRGRGRPRKSEILSTQPTEPEREAAGSSAEPLENLEAKETLVVTEVDADADANIFQHASESFGNEMREVEQGIMDTIEGSTIAGDSILQ